MKKTLLILLLLLTASCAYYPYSGGYNYYQYPYYYGNYDPARIVDAGQDIQLIHRIRQEAVKRRTALVNQIRGLLGERGIVIGQGIHQVRKSLPELLEDAESALTTLSRAAFAEQYERLLELDKEIKRYDQKMGQLCQANELSKRLAEVPGVGPMTATIVAADLGEDQHYVNARHYSASLGTSPGRAAVAVNRYC